MTPRMNAANTYPPSGLPRIITSMKARCMEPAPRGLLRSMMRHPEADDFDNGNGNMMYNQRDKRVTQEEQDEEDEEARKRAMKNLISSWQERLQLISVITTFFATTEAAMLVNTKPGIGDFDNKILRASNAGFLGSLILHVYASVLSFMGAFLLISYKLREAAREEMIVEGITVSTSPREGCLPNDVEQGIVGQGILRTPTGKDSQSMLEIKGTETSTPGPNNRSRDGSVHSAEPPIFAANPHVEQVGPFGSRITSYRLLSRIHAICVSLTALGFALALIGVICYAWALLPTSVAVFTSACLGGAILSMFVLLI